MKIAAVRGKDGIDPVRLLETATHDLRNPISGILAASQYLLEDAVSRLDEHHVALLQSIDSSSRSMLRLIEDILELCDIESGKLRLGIATTNIQPLINRAVILSQTAAERKKVHLAFDPCAHAPAPPLEIDPARVLHALDSLIGSLVKLARPGTKIEISAGVKQGRVAIWLRSDGVALSANAMRSLFDPFKNRSSRPGIEGGTALSLATVKQIVTAHGGVVRVEDGGTGGVTVKLAIPLPATEPARRHVAGAAFHA
jgi:signal transduction histidine kinase